MSKSVLVIATRNKGKEREYEALFRDLPLQIRSLSEFQEFPEIEEVGTSFREIAIEKARSVSGITGVPGLADDSGLAVEILNGAPGIFSARYAGESADDYRNNRKLLDAMKGNENRKASFLCCIALAKPAGKVLTYTGRCSGQILDEPAGTNGFGYDPLFYYPPLKRSFAELLPEEKNTVSHRGRAITKLKDDLENVLIWLSM